MNPAPDSKPPGHAGVPPATSPERGGAGGNAPWLKDLKSCLLILLGLATAACLSLALLMYRVIHPAEIRSLEAYPQKYAKLHQDWAPHFPAEIPADATLKKFCYFPGRFNGNWYMQLRLRRPETQIRALYDQHLMQRTKSFHGGSNKDHQLQEDGMWTTYFYTGDEPAGTQDPAFPPDYEVMVFDPILTPEEKQQLHSSLFCHGVAISLQRNEIVYWTAVW